MNLLKKIFGTPRTAAQPAGRAAHEELIRQHTDTLWKFIEEALVQYKERACPCAYPRFRQVVAIDCVDYRKNFYCSETEGFIDRARSGFTIIKQESGPEAYNEKWTCTTCGSVYDFGWSDFSIHVNRAFLKIKDVKVADVGAPARLPIPLFVGLFGHTLPGKEEMVPVPFETFREHMLELAAR